MDKNGHDTLFNGSGWYHQTMSTDPLMFCLIWISKYHQRSFSPSAVLAGLPLDKGLLTADSCVRAAERIGFHAQILNQPLTEIVTSALPAILLTNDHQAIVLEKRYHETYSLINLKGEPIQKNIHELSESYSGQMIALRPEYQFRNDHLIEDTKAKQSWFWGTIKKMWGIYSEAIIASFLINLFVLASPLFVMNVYDRVVPNNATDTLWVLTSGVLLVFIFDFTMRLLRGYFIDQASKYVDTHLSATIFAQILGLKMSVRPPSMGVLAHLVHSFEAFREFITSTTITAVVDLPFSVLFLIVIFMLGGWLVMIPLLAIPLVILVGFIIQRPLNRLIKQSFRYGAEKQATLFESLNNIETIKILGAESTLQNRYEQVSCLAAALNTKLHLLSNMTIHFSMLAQQLTSIFVVLAGVYRIGTGDMTTGALIACTILTGRALAPMTQVASLITRYHQSVEGLQAADKIMQMPTERNHKIMPLHKTDTAGKIEFRNVNFTYPNQSHPALKNISLIINPGERVGIIGKIGSGKSTLSKLILNLYQPDDGLILFDDFALLQYDVADIRRKIGYVPQDVYLLNGTVRENIIVSAPQIDDAPIIKAAEISGVQEFIKDNPLGFNAQVGENGAQLSGGQRQTVAIARAVLMNPPVLILDEPTHSMDERTEQIVKNHLENYLNNKTLVLISHRKSMLTLVDRIILMEAGQILADGPKDVILNAIAKGEIRASYQ